MNFTECPLLARIFISVFGLILILGNSALAQEHSSDCPDPALQRFQKHKVIRGETLQSVAEHYNLLPETILTMNPNLGKSLTVGSDILIPPYNGIVVEVPGGQTWRQVAAKYKVRPDVLYEVNGCQKNPKIVFVPGVDGSGKQIAIKSQNSTSSQEQSYEYPLPQVANLALPYGWQINPKTGQVFFHSGVDLLAAVGTPVKTISSGTVVFAGEKGSYGKLVIINHDGGLQSRYAHLNNIKVTTGQQLKQGDVLGTVGTTGQPDSNQPHLHFEVRSNSSLGWVAQDPNQYLNR